MTKNKSEKKSNKPGKKKSSSKGENKRMKKEAMINAIINVFKSSPKEPFNNQQYDRSYQSSAEVAGSGYPV